MPGPKLLVDWQDSAETLGRLYRAETDIELRTRFHALWLLRQGRAAQETAELVGAHPRTLRKWLAWYRAGGVAGLREHRHGGCQGRAAYLTPEQCRQLVEWTAQGGTRSIAQAQVWIRQQFGVVYTYWGMRSLLARLKISQKVPRPQAVKASPAAQEAWKKGAWQPL